MKDLYLDEITKDLTLTNTKTLRFTSNNNEYVSQKIEQLLKTMQGEWILDQSLGIPYFNINDRRDKTKNILGIKNPDLNFITSILLKEIKTIKEITEVEKFDIVFQNSNRNLKIDIVCKITDETRVEVEVTI